ncbi:MAG: zeta toxin family protein [Legionella sp.]
MPILYSQQRINFDTVTDTDLPRYEYHRTLRGAISLSATSYSQQKTGEGAIYQWDNIAPEVALVIIQDAQKQGINIPDEVIQVQGIEAFNQAQLEKALEKLHSNHRYALFIEKLALQITGEKSTKLTLENLKLAGITTLEQFDKAFIHYLYAENKLVKSFPNFGKISEDDDYHQFVTFLASDPLYESFFLSFTQNLATEYNQGRIKSLQVEAPQEIDTASLFKFLQAIGYDLVLDTPESTPLKKNTLYVKVLKDKLQYTVIDLSDNEITETIPFTEMDFPIDKNTTEEEFKNHLPNILKITSQRKHTGNNAINNTASLRDKGIDFLNSDVGSRSFLSHVPAVDLVKDEGYKFSLYQWLQQGNLDRLKNLLVVQACQHYNQHLDAGMKQIKEPTELDSEFKEEIDAVGTLMKEIVTLIASLEDDPNEKDSALDEKITTLIKHIKTIRELYTSTPILNPGEHFPSTSGNFENFIKRVIYNATGDKLIQYVPDSQDQGKFWKLNLVDLVVGLSRDRSFVAVRDSKNKNERSFLTDKSGSTLSPALVLREQLKTNITTNLKNDIHHYHTVHSYENDKLSTTESPVVFRGGSLTDSLAETKHFAKKITRVGEYSADSHLLAGQENNVKKHEVRSGTAATLAATGAGGTRSVTDKFDIAMKFGGIKEVRILYIVRGKAAFHSQPFAEMMGKTKLGEIAYTHLNPHDYVMTILYDRNNVILDVIPGNLNGEIQGINAFSKDVIAAGIDFYNQKHDTSRLSQPVVKLPDPLAEQTIITSSAPARKPLLNIIHTHKATSESLVKATPPAKKLASVRITRSSQGGHKQLSMDTIQPALEAVPVPDTLERPEGSFSIGTRRLHEVREQAVAHFNMRHVLTLKSFDRWNAEERRLQEQYNRILQPNFMEGDIQDQLKHANTAHEDWLTDVLVPKMQTALMLHLATRLFTDYQVDVEEVNEIAQTLFQNMQKSSECISQLTEVWSKMYKTLNQSEVQQNCVKKAHERMTKLYPTLSQDSHQYEARFKSCFIMEKNKIQKKLVNESMSGFLDSRLDHFAQELRLQKKTVYSFAENRDFVFLGPAASGKSTISSQHIKKEDKKNYISLATDDYRSIILPYTEEFERQETEQVFIRTQDSAFLISELIDERLQSLKDARPNVIIDGVTYKPAHKALVEKNNNSVIVCACLDDMSHAVKRSYDRAQQEESGSADKGRYVNTTSLINMHKTASLNLLIYCAPNTTFSFYNTNVPRGTNPPLIATVNTHGEKTLTINHEKCSLLYLASFFNKARANVGAKSDKHLFLSKLKRPEFQIDSLLAVMNHGFKIVLNGEPNKPCLIVKKETDGHIVMNILDPVQLKAKLQENVAETPLLQMLLLYGKLGSLKAVQKECLLHDDINPVIDELINSQTEADTIPLSL